MKTKILASSTIGRTLRASVLSFVLVVLGPGVIRVEANASLAAMQCDSMRPAEIAWFDALGDYNVESECTGPTTSVLAAAQTLDSVPAAKRQLTDVRPFAGRALTTTAPQATEPAARSITDAPARILTPLTIGPLRDKAPCQATTLNVIAHEDDDLLFMNPDVSRDVAAGRCIRTVYLTAGDAGMPSAYWQGREAGAKAAYAAMTGQANEWLDSREQLAGRFVAVSYLKAKPNVSLLFLRLPDGDLRGAGFAASGSQSLAQLIEGGIPAINSVDDRTPYTLGEVQGVISQLLVIDKPDDIRTLNADDHHDGDHSDHHATGQLVRMAVGVSAEPEQVSHYIGYPIAAMPANVFDAELAAKQEAFMQYALHDGAVCSSVDACVMTAYGSYLGRQYQARPPVIATAVAP